MSLKLPENPSILMVRLGSLGDIVHAIPALLDLREAFPAARIDWLCEAPYRALLEQTRGLDAVRVADTMSWRRSPTSWGEPVRLVRQLRRRRYDVALDFQGLLKSAVLARLSGARQRIGFDAGLAREPQAARLYTGPRSPDPTGLHRCQLNQRLLRPLGVEPKDRVQLPIDIPPGDDAYVMARLAELKVTDPVLLNPGAGWPSKLWPVERYVALARRLEENSEGVVFVYGPGEEGLIEQARREAPPELSIRAFPTTILQLAALCRRSRLLVASDTGPLHLAVALGTPTVALMGPTWAWRNGPFCADDVCVRVERDCPYAYKRTCPGEHFCMDMTVEQVFDAVQRRLEGV